MSLFLYVCNSYFYSYICNSYTDFNLTDVEINFINILINILAGEFTNKHIVRCKKQKHNK